LTPRAKFSTMLWLKTDMTCSRQRKLKPVLRICASLMVLIWIVASGFCSAEPLLGHAESGGEHHSNQAAHHEDEAAPSSTDAGQSHDSDQHKDGEHSCCASLKATPQFGGSANLTKFDFAKSFSLNSLWLAQALTFVQPEVPFSRQPPGREWVFTPEVCLGPAFRSHAPPLAV
jgi:hypothetical protein